MKAPTRNLLNLLLLGSIVLSACQPQADVNQGERPGNPVYAQLIWDCNTGESLPAAGDTIQPSEGCDSWQINRYERPFNAESQDTYFADLDILSAELGQDSQWTYFRLTLFDENAEDGYLGGTYAIEIDIDIDGRGDVLALAKAPGENASENWTVQGVQLWGDSDNDVGNQVPLAPDPPSNSNGYDTLFFNEGEGEDPGLAWVRIQPGKPAVMELAFKSSAIYNDPIFKWWAWSDQGVDDPAGADYHDTFDHPEAGDPIQGQAYFPSRAINELDNTCTSIWGAAPGSDPDLCANDPYVPPPTLVPTQTLTPSFTATSDGSPTPSPTPEDTTGTKTPTPTEPVCVTPTAQASLTPTGNGQTAGIPTATPSPQTDGANTGPAGAANLTTTPSPDSSPNVTPTASATANTFIEDCTPTPTPSPTITATLCPENPNSTVNNTPCTPTPTVTPTRCFIYDNTGQFIDCTPTPSPSPTPTECAVAYAFANVNCTPTPTLQPSLTPTRCAETNSTTGQLEACTPTPSLTPTATVCVVYSTTYFPCTPTMTPTACVDPATGAQCSPTPTIDTAMPYFLPLQNTNCRRAPNGQVLDTLYPGTAYYPLGRGTDNVWIALRGPVTNNFCWVPAALVQVFYPGQLTTLDQIPGEVLPYYFYPTVTPTPTFAPPVVEPSRTPTCTPKAGSVTGAPSGGC